MKKSLLFAILLITTAIISQDALEMTKHLVIHLQRQPLAYAAQRGMIGRRFRQTQPYEGPHRQGIAKTPTNAPLRIDALETAKEQHAEIPARRNGAATFVVGVERGAEVLDKGVESALIQQPVQFFVKRVARTLRQLMAGHPKRLLTFRSPTKAQRGLLKNERRGRRGISL